MAELKLYNTLSRKKEAFTPRDPGNIQMYVCGPTVYDFAHIGNARPVIVFDVLFRLLRHQYGENHVTYVRNITDVDDKINARALRDYPDLPLNEAIRHVTEKTAKQFHEDVEALGCLPPTHEPRATEFILPRTDGKTDMETLIQRLLDKGHAYIATGEEGKEVLFNVKSMDEYGSLSNRRLEDQQAGARVEAKTHKKNAGDFVLWKESQIDMPGWDGAFNGEIIHGRPGWHIECSAMSAAYLGETFDIHGGGLDLIFPHHENEIAQSCCAHGTDKMANIWMHNGYLQVEGKKMSKSDGNFVTIHELLQQPIPALVATENRNLDWQVQWNGLATRLSMLQTHYREPIDWTQRRFIESSNELMQWYELLKDVSHDTKLITSVRGPFVKALGSDMNTWECITLLRAAAKARDTRSLGEGMDLLGLLKPEFLSDDVLTFERSSHDIDEQAKELVHERLEHLKAKNFAEADRIRDELLAQGIQLKDSKDSETGERITTWEVKQ